MKYKILIVFVIFLLASCTSVSLNRKEIEREFGSQIFKLANPMYLSLYLNCGIFRVVYEDKIADIDFIYKIDPDDVAYFDKYKNIKVGDGNCTPSNDIRVYKLLNVGQEVKIDSIVDVLNASWWFWRIKGAVSVGGESFAFQMQLPYEKNKSLRSSLSDVFVLQN